MRRSAVTLFRSETKDGTQEIVSSDYQICCVEFYAHLRHNWAKIKTNPSVAPKNK